MRNSMLRKWTTPNRLALTLVAALPAFAFADSGDQLHTLLRTASEIDKVARVTSPTTEFSMPELFEARPGGLATHTGSADFLSLSQPNPAFSDDDQFTFVLGEALFDKLWVQSPSSTRASDGLGPLYNARSCAACHIENGRGLPPDGSHDAFPGLVLHISTPENTAVPGFGWQLQDIAVTGMAAEGQLTLTYATEAVELPGGETVDMHSPRYGIENTWRPFPDGTRISPRIAPPLIGLGLLAAIPEADILAHADPLDRDGDGISGRANFVTDPATEAHALGRFGWKANHATVRAQTAAALAQDVGISSPLRADPWGDCTPEQTLCRTALHGDDDIRDGYEIDSDALDVLTHYTAGIAVPPRRDLDDPDVLSGKRLFYTTGCTSCHVPKFVTARTDPAGPTSFQLIWPYSDMLLHDMGPGLADNRPDGLAWGQEWRTPPLWGIGLTALITGQHSYLHDGRAKSLAEAILWHGGEAQPARDRFADMSASDRAALIRFLESL